MSIHSQRAVGKQSAGWSHSSLGRGVCLAAALICPGCVLPSCLLLSSLRPAFSLQPHTQTFSQSPLYQALPDPQARGSSVFFLGGWLFQAIPKDPPSPTRALYTKGPDQTSPPVPTTQPRGSWAGVDGGAYHPNSLLRSPSIPSAPEARSLLGPDYVAHSYWLQYTTWGEDRAPQCTQGSPQSPAGPGQHQQGHCLVLPCPD